MDTKMIVIAVITFVLSASCFIIAFLQAKEIGPLFHNAYLYASKTERANMNRKPYYRMSRNIFVMLGISFLADTLQTILKWLWLNYVVIAMFLIVIAYSIIKTIEQYKTWK